MSKIDDALALMDEGATLANACRQVGTAKPNVCIAAKYREQGREEMRGRVVAALKDRSDVVVSCGKVADAIERMGR